MIWDIAGNVSEWVSDNNTAGNYGLGVRYISTLAENHPAKARFGPSGDYSNIFLENSSYGNLGQFSGAGGGIVRGGHFYGDPGYPQNTGVFATHLGGLGGFFTLGFRWLLFPLKPNSHFSQTSGLNP